MVAPLAVTLEPTPLTLSAALFEMVKVPLNCEAPPVSVNVRPEIVNALPHWMLRTVTSLAEITTPLSAPLVMATSFAGPGTVPPLQLDPLVQETPSPAPVQVLVWPKLAMLPENRITAAKTP